MAEDNPIRKAIDIASDLAKAAWNSRLKKYFVYSIGIHAALLVVLSVGGIIELARGASEGDESAQDTSNVSDEPDEPPTSPTSARDDDAPTGDSEDYFRRAGIDTTPPPAEETPDSPDDILDELMKPDGR